MNGSSKARPIPPAEGKLGILLPGMGAVATTFIAGVEAIRRGLSRPIGSLTQMGTVRLGKRTDNRSPRIGEFVPLATLDQLEFAGVFSSDYLRKLDAATVARLGTGSFDRADPGMPTVTW